MSRGVGELELAAALPEPIVVLAALLTALGDVWFIFLLLGVLYWFGTTIPGPLSLSRRHAAFVIALAFGGLALITALKELLQLPRPPNASEPAGAELIPQTVLPIYAELGAASGFGFPSGHAVAAVVVYGGLAVLIGTRRGYVMAIVLCAVIPLSRIALGVHYLVDIVVGVAVGIAYLAVTVRLCGQGSNPGRAMMIALAVALLGAAIGYTSDTMFALGGALGMRMGWGIVGGAVVHESVTRRGGAIATGFGLVFAVLFGAVYAFDVAPHVGFLGMFVVVWGVLAAPLAGEAIARRL